MTAIPPNWLGSIIQTQGAARRAGEQRAQESSSQAEGARDSFSKDLQNVIENSDRDGQVYSDAEGAGSQGKPFEDNPEEPETTAPDDETGDDDAGLDLQA